MAHERDGPDLVMTSRYVGASEIRQLTDHEKHRTPDGSSAIDPMRTHLNKILHGPSTQQEALEKLWEAGVKRPAAQAERPYVQTVISASTTYFRDEHHGPGEWHSQRLEAWLTTTMAWLAAEFGQDLVHVALHLDEDTPHLHILVVPTYDKKARRPGKPFKDETPQEFDARVAVARNTKTQRTAGRSSNKYWSQMSVLRRARQSYHAAVEPLGIGYGRDFVAEGEPSPKRKPTGMWVREETARLAEERRQIVADRSAFDLEQERAKKELGRARLEISRMMMRAKNEAFEIVIDAKLSSEDERRILSEGFIALEKAVGCIGDELALVLSPDVDDAMENLQQKVADLTAVGASKSDHGAGPRI
ncbi:plasmid recombination protein [Lentibacter sp. XHP0401]|uniref:plasmid recombination protein n=1 Tax=Lentibacter sp. XHP0401 TaxID=2984334 RepID=UPI0021E746D7|nr:plasmid recombination protein [Lentibacter sp. XHP0401]MCV2894513.1 plasmid recombination protein [Lentibacter sp. XHP0401]